jgi:hypothetical protein
MNSRLETYERRLETAHRLGRFKKYLSLCGIGVALWLDDLWSYALRKVEAGEQMCDNWFMQWLCGSAGLRVSTILSFLNLVSLMAFSVLSAWLVYWAYMDTYVRKARGENSWSFSKKLVVGACINLCIYGALRLATNPYL